MKYKQRNTNSHYPGLNGAKRRIIIILLSVIALIACSNRKQAVKIEDFCGVWSSVFIPEEEIQSNSFEIRLEKDSIKENTLKGWHCSVIRGGRRIDCVTPDEIPTITGYLKRDTVYVNTISSFGGNCRAKIYMIGTEKQLVWEMIKYSGEHYLPFKKIMERKDNKNEHGNIPSAVIDKKTYASDIRLNEQLELEEVYTDIFEYIDYQDEGDDFFIIVKKDDKTYSLVDNQVDLLDLKIDRIELLGLNRGDLLEIQWKIDSLIPAGDPSTLFLKEYVEKITKTDEGKLSVFRKTHKKSRHYMFDPDIFNYKYQTEIKNDVDYFLANTTDEGILQALNDYEEEFKINAFLYLNEEPGESSSSCYPHAVAAIRNDYTPVIQLGIGREYDNYYEKIYYRFNEETGGYVRIQP